MNTGEREMPKEWSEAEKSNLRPEIVKKYPNQETLTAAHEKLLAEGDKRLFEAAQRLAKEIDPHFSVTQDKHAGLDFEYMNEDGSVNKELSFRWSRGGLFDGFGDLDDLNKFLEGGAFEDKIRGAFDRRKREIERQAKTSQLRSEIRGKDSFRA